VLEAAAITEILNTFGLKDLMQIEPVLRQLDTGNGTDHENLLKLIKLKDDKKFIKHGGERIWGIRGRVEPVTNGATTP
jgi:hypothetical protein